MQRISQIQIFGERCSGTNFLESLLRNNFPSIEITWRFGWKHFFPKQPLIDTAHCLFIVIHRDPFDWLQSFHKKPHHAAPALKRISFSKFIRHEWWCEWRESTGIERGDPAYGAEMMFERNPDTGDRFITPMQLRTAKIRHWAALENEVENIKYVSYGRLILDQEGWLTELSRQFFLDKHPTFLGVSTYKGHMRKKFTEKRYPPISIRDIDFIADQLDHALEASVGYDINKLAQYHRHLSRRLSTANMHSAIGFVSRFIGL